MRPLLALLGREPDSSDREGQTAALTAATALRRLCDSSLATAAFCQAGGLDVVVSRIVTDAAADRQPLRLPMPLGPSTVRAECKQLLGARCASTLRPHECRRITSVKPFVVAVSCLLQEQ